MTDAHMTGTCEAGVPLGAQFNMASFRCAPQGLPLGAGKQIDGSWLLPLHGPQDSHSPQPIILTTLFPNVKFPGPFALPHVLTRKATLP